MKGSLVSERHRKLERMAVLIQEEARHLGIQAQGNYKYQSSKIWWVVESSMAEAVHAMRSMRLGPEPKKGPKSRQLDSAYVDHFGVPEKVAP